MTPELVHCYETPVFMGVLPFQSESRRRCEGLTPGPEPNLGVRKSAPKFARDGLEAPTTPADSYADWAILHYTWRFYLAPLP